MTASSRDRAGRCTVRSLHCLDGPGQAAGLWAALEPLDRRRSLEPFGASSVRIPHRARGYELSSTDKMQNAVFVDVSNKPPGSGINSTARDMGNFLAALYSAKLIFHSTLEQMLTPAKTRDGKATIYGLGFFLGGPISSYKRVKEAGHGGDQQGFSSILYLLPEKQFGVVILSNMETKNISLDFVGLSRKIYDIVSPQ